MFQGGNCYQKITAQGTELRSAGGEGQLPF